MLTTTPRQSIPTDAAGSTPVDPADVPPRGDFARIVDDFQSPLLRYAQRLLGPGDDAEDVVQDAFVRYHKQHVAGDKPAPDSPKSWPIW